LTADHVALTAADTVEPALNTPIAANETVSIIRNGIHTQSVAQTIVMPTQYIADSNLSYVRMRRSDRSRQEVLTYQVDVQNGQVVSQTLIKQSSRFSRLLR